VVGNRYLLEEVLGAGSMGIVYAARHLGLDERVALKVIHPGLRRDVQSRARFSREAKITSRLRTAHVARVLDAGECPVLGLYLVMEHLSGLPLNELLSRGGRLSVRRAVGYVLEACEAVRAAHAIGVVHRDLKPGNLFLTRLGGAERIKLLDFGISKASLSGRVLGSDLEFGQTTYLMGTPLYMSPEQVRGATDVDARTDIWALGAVLHELVTGEQAFTGESVPQICSQILESDPPRLSHRAPDAPPSLQAIVDRCLAKRRSERFGSVGELCCALEALSFGDDAAAMPGKPCPPEAPSGRRSLPFEWVFAALALATLLSAWFAHRPAPDPLSPPDTGNPTAAESAALSGFRSAAPR
jgi:serine/threonine-protein kinase